jgi:hypothetical protein
MKFWKSGILTALLFSAFVVIITHSSCERNVCDNITCFNGGSCNVGACRCPIGWEGPQCQDESRQRYIGVYSGYSTCNNGAYLLDSAWITKDPGRLNWVFVTYKSIQPRVLHGYVSNNEATYSVIIANDSGLNYQKIYTLTLQGDKMLSISTYETDFQPNDTTINKCSFLGSKQ